MIVLTLADLRFRARQFLLAMVGVTLVLAIALMLAGMAAGFRTEIVRTTDGVGADRWVLADASNGRFTSFAAFPQSVSALIAAEPGVRRADPLLLLVGQVADVGSRQVTYCLMGVRRGGLGDPMPASGHGIDGPGQVVADTKLHLDVGQRLVLGGRPFSVVGTVPDRTLIGGVGLMYMGLSDAQSLAVGGRTLVSAIVTKGAPTAVPSGFAVRTPEQIVQNAENQLASGKSSINSMRWFMWVLAVFIVAALLYVAALDRQRDFAVLKALGSSSSALFFSLSLEAVAVTVMASVFAELIGNGLAPLFPQPVDIPLSAYVTLPVIAVAVGVLSSMVALRKATGADPAAAFS